MTLGPGPIAPEPLGENAVVSRFSLRSTARASGRSVEMRLVEVYTVRGGKIVELDVH